jgi:hypothetical protein
MAIELNFLSTQQKLNQFPVLDYPVFSKLIIFLDVNLKWSFINNIHTYDTFNFSNTKVHVFSKYALPDTDIALRVVLWYTGPVESCNIFHYSP